jgi:hypothetical protein
VNKQQKFLSALVDLCKEYDVSVSGTFAVWPRGVSDDAKMSKAILADVEGADPTGLYVGRRSERYMPRPWAEGMTAAYNAGLEDAREGIARPQRADGFDACYWQGWTHGQKRG